MKIPKWFFVFGIMLGTFLLVYMLVVVIASAGIYNSLNNAISRYEKQPDTTITIYNGKPDTVIVIKNK